MSDFSPSDLETTPASRDPGDETANRYRYQWTWAAIVCCMLLDDTEDLVEVFCEHHEDVLLKHRDGTFSGHQVKTRGDDQQPWKAKDESVLAACARFSKLEAKYPGQFRRFCFLTNHQLHSAENGQDLTFVLESIKKAETISQLPSSIKLWIKRVATDADETESIVFDAMSKSVAKADLPKLRDAVMRCVDTIVQCWAPATECSYESIKRAAQALIEECGRASSLSREQLLPAYLIATMDEDEEIATRIDGKRMALIRVQEILEQGRDSAATLQGDLSQNVQPGEGSTDLLHQKLDAGGFSAVSRNSAEDLRDKADYLGLMWIKKYGNPKGITRYNHVRSIVLSDAGRAFDATHNENDSFGPTMREDLRRRFRERHQGGNQLFDSTDDHLEGIAFSLTAQCEIVWSHARPWETE